MCCTLTYLLDATVLFPGSRPISPSRTLPASPAPSDNAAGEFIIQQCWSFGSLKPYLTFTAAVLLEKVASSFFAQESNNTKYLNEFVKGLHTLPTTQGNISGLPSVRMRGGTHCSTSTTPSLLFFDLPECREYDASIDKDKGKGDNAAEEILRAQPSMRHLPLFGVSGCGKTRTAIELLSRTWGLYFNAGNADHGSHDMHALKGQVVSFEDKYMTQDKHQNTINACHLTLHLLYARLWILNYCLSIPGCEKTFTPQRWMLLQVATTAFQDVFWKLFDDILQLFDTHTVSITDTMVEVRTLFRKIRKQLTSRPQFSPLVQSKFLIVLDEAQELGEHTSGLGRGLAFLDSDGKTSRPLLAPVLHSIRRISSHDDEICVLPCGTGLSDYDLTWSGGSASGIKLPACEYSMKANNMDVVDFPGWVSENSIRQYVNKLGEALDSDSKNRLTALFSDALIQRLFLDLRGRFRPIISAIEDIIHEDDPTQWETCIDKLLERLTSADIDPNSTEITGGNLCAELFRFLSRVESDPVSFPQGQLIRATLKFAIAAYITSGGFLAYKGDLSEVVEVAFGRIKKYNGERYTVIDEPFALIAADNFFRKTDPGYIQHQKDMLATCTDECTRGRYWETIVPANLVEMFHDKVVSKHLFNGSQLPHEMFERKAEIIGCRSALQVIRHGSMTMEEFLDAHYFHDSRHNDQRVPPLFFPKQYESGPDIIFVVRFVGTDSDAPIVCPVFVQLKLRTVLRRSDAENARATVQPKSISNHKVDLTRYCSPHNQYISLLVSYPAEITKFFQRESLSMQHEEGVTEIALTVDNKNIRSLFSKEYVDMLDCVKRLGMDVDEEELVRKRQGGIDAEEPAGKRRRTEATKKKAWNRSN